MPVAQDHLLGCWWNLMNGETKKIKNLILFIFQSINIRPSLPLPSTGSWGMLSSHQGVGWGRGDGWMDGWKLWSDAHLFSVCFLVDWQSQQDDRPIPDGGGDKEGGCRDANSTWLDCNLLSSTFRNHDSLMTEWPPPFHYSRRDNTISLVCRV